MAGDFEKLTAQFEIPGRFDRRQVFRYLMGHDGTSVGGAGRSILERAAQDYYNATRRHHAAPCAIEKIRARACRQPSHVDATVVKPPAAQEYLQVILTPTIIHALQDAPFPNIENSEAGCVSTSK
jgi:hypothetical protein